MKDIKISRLFSVVERALFCDSGLSYHRTLEAIKRLSQEINLSQTQESVWEIEAGACSLASLIVGAYAFCSDLYSGQFSPEYECLCALKKVFSPGIGVGSLNEEEGLIYEALKEKEKE